VDEVRKTGRNAQGVRLVNLDANDIVCAVARVVPEKDEGGEGGEGVDGLAPVGGEDEE
jgi:DNA gyrase subunit A